MNHRLGTFLLALPGLIWWGLFLVAPVGLILAYAFYMRGTYGGVIPDFTFENIQRLFDELYFSIFLNSLRIAAIATVIAVLIGYPAAYAIARSSPRWQVTLLILVILPFWSNYLIRTYAWIVLLSRTGLVNSALLSMGVINEPIEMLYTEPAVIIGLVYSYLPFVVLTTFASIQRMNFELLDASEDLGASSVRTFLKVTLPLTLPGIAAGAVFVFVLSVGNFVTPDLIGGKHVVMIGNVIQSQFTGARDWPFGAALSLMLLTIMVGLLALQSHAQSRLRRTEGEARDV